MELKIQRSEFLKSLQRCQGIVPVKGAMSILSYLLLQTVPGGIELAATDLEISIRSFGEAQVLAEGQVTLLARKAFEIARELPEAEIHLIQQPNNTLKLVCAQADFIVGTLPAEDFPTLPSYNEEDLGTMESPLLAEAIRKTILAVPTGEARYSMNGALLEIENGQLTMVGTDGHRLACFSKKIASGESLAEAKVILPKKLLLELRKLLEAEPNSLRLAFQEKHAIFKTGEAVLTGRLIEGNFPDHKRVIPSETPDSRQVKVNKEAFIHALRRVSLLSDERSRGVKVRLSWGQMLLNSQDSEWGDAHEIIEADYKGEEITLGFNATYLLEILGVIDEEEITLGINEVLGPCLLTPVGNPDYLCVVMPLRLD